MSDAAGVPAVQKDFTNIVTVFGCFGLPSQIVTSLFPPTSSASQPSTMASFTCYNIDPFTCPLCSRDFRSASGLTQHQNAFHRDCSPDRSDTSDEAMYMYQYHPHINGIYFFYSLLIIL